MTSSLDLSLFVIDPNNVLPLYHQIKQNIRGLIDDNVLSEGDLMPSERELAETYDVNRLTVRQALDDLVSEGILRRQRGIGTFVAKPKLTQTLGRVLGFSERVREAGRTPSNQVISFELVPAPVSIARRLNVAPNSPMFKLVRLRCSDDDPVMLETAYLSESLFPDLDTHDFVTESLYRVLAENYGINVVEAEEILEPVIMTAYEVSVLKAETGTPGMRVESISYDQNGHAVELGKSVVRGDKSRYLFRIKRQAVS